MRFSTPLLLLTHTTSCGGGAFFTLLALRKTSFPGGAACTVPMSPKTTVEMAMELMMAFIFFFWFGFFARKHPSGFNC